MNAATTKAEVFSHTALALCNPNPDAAVPRGGEFIAAASGFSWGGSIAALAVVSLFSAASVCGCAPAYAKGAPLSTPVIAQHPTKRLAAAAGTPAVSPAAAAASQ